MNFKEEALKLGINYDSVMDEKFNIFSVADGKKIYDQRGFSGLPDASVVAEVTDITDGTKVVGKNLKVTSKVGKAEYVYSRDYYL